jgi:esterase FrsA
VYTYPIESEAMFEDRAGQFAGFGIPVADIQRMRDTITDMWLVGPGGWVHEWSQLAADYAFKGDHYLASLVYGCAKFPCLADPQREGALAKQVEEYLAAAPTFPVRFERRILTLPYQGGTVEVPVHLYTTADDYAELPVIVFSGGVDTWKMDIHNSLIATATHGGATVLAFDMPGTGEISHVLLAASADEVVLGVVAAGKELGNGKVGHIALSFGGNFSAMTGLLGAVDAAVDDGGPVRDSFTIEHLSTLRYGMQDIVGNAMGFDTKPSVDELLAASEGLNRAALLETATNSAMLVVNGADDYFVPQSDTLVFEGRPNTEVHLIEGTGHVAMSKMSEVMPMMIGWLRTQLSELPAARAAAS